MADGAGDGAEERADLAELLARRALTEDAARPEAVARRHATGGRTARENLADLVDPGSFVEYGRFAIAAQRGRRELEDLIARTPADGFIGGTATVNGELFGDDAACAVLSYDYTVLAGTQGALGHLKKDRLFELIERLRLPTVLFAEGGGGRPGDTDYPVVSALDTRAFALWARLSGLVPRIAIVAGRCFAGNAVLAGCSDLIIATEGSSLGMGGPAMIEGGGLGVFEPQAVGPIDVQWTNGVVDLRVKDDAEAVAAARRYLSYFHGATPPGEERDQEPLRNLIPTNRKRIYDVRGVIDAWCVDNAIQYIGAPATSFTGGEHLGGQTVTGLADGVIIPPFVMPSSGAFTLATPASTVTVGLAYTCDLQTLPLDLSGQEQVQGKVKKINSVTARLENTLNLRIGPNFDQLTMMKDTVQGNVSSMRTGLAASAQVVTDLYTGDARTYPLSAYTVPGQYCLRQSDPLPATVLGLFPSFEIGDSK